jgi:hypothetical protein
MSVRRVLIAAALLSFGAPMRAANWDVDRVNHMVLTPPAGVTVQEMSGVTYVGPAGGAHRFIAAEQTKGELVQFDVTVNASGAITAISNVAAIDIASSADLEGIAYTNASRNSVFASDELAAGPRIVEVNLATGNTQQAVTIPSVFAGHTLSNRGFESLTRSLDAKEMWTGNEEALTVDGAAATPDAGTVVRLVRFNVAGNAVTAAQQYAYSVEPMHGPYLLGNGQSGLSDLTLMPDGTLLALERSLANVATLAYRSRIFEIDFAGATDVSVGPPAGGLAGQSYTPVAKQELFDGAADGALGQNLEGLALGPRLANGSWLLVGVVDDRPGDLDSLSANTVVAFTATANVTGDFDADGDADGADLMRWQRGLGKTIGSKLADGDGDRDGDVDAADLAVWKGDFAVPASAAVPEPSTLAMAAAALMSLGMRRRRLAES